MIVWELNEEAPRIFSAKPAPMPLVTETDSITIIHGAGNIRTLAGEDIKMAPGAVYNFDYKDGCWQQRLRIGG